MSTLGPIGHWRYQKRRRPAFLAQKWGWWALLSIGGCLASGCQITLSDMGEAGFRYGTEFAFFHRTSTTNAKSVAEAHSQPIEEWLRRGAPQQTDGTPTGSMATPGPGQ